MADRRNLEKVKELAAYRVSEEVYVERMDSRAMVLGRIKSGTRIFPMPNEDENKVFHIGFRTPSDDSMGLPHILEHSVLEGSDRFPVKDPFVELAKGSLNTFLNAMTYPDKTVYSVTSCNGKNFQNLMDVYLDGVLHSAIYREPKIFLQEGWHHELESPEDELTISGVVYNEMKGAFSSPESVPDRFTRNVLFPDTTYSNGSGGGPVVIPQLTYEKFIALRRNYYHPANSYIYLYGDIDMAQKLTWLDQEYLGHYDRKDYYTDSAIATQQPFEQPVQGEITYSVTEEEGTKDRTYLPINTVVGMDLEPVLYVAFQILRYTLINAPGATLKQALIDAGIGQDILGDYDCGTLQPYFSVIAKGANPEQKGEFLTVVKGTLRRLADQGIDRKSLLVGLNLYEFCYRETNYGSVPKGLMYGLWPLNSWLHGGESTLHLEYQKTFDYLKKVMEGEYFEQLIHRYLLDNPHEAVIAVHPRVNQTVEEDRNLAEKLKAYKEFLGRKELKTLAAWTRRLKEYQEGPSWQEDLEKIPMLQRKNIRREGGRFSYEIKAEDGVTVIHSSLFTSGIGCLKVLFDISRVSAEDPPYVGLLKAVLGYVDTEHYSYGDLTSEIYLNSGVVSFAVSSYPDATHPGQFAGAFVTSAKVLYHKLDSALSVLSGILTRSKLDDEKRLGEILDETRSRARVKMEDAFHGAVVGRASSYFSASAAFNDITDGIGYYQFLKDVSRGFAEDVSYRGQLIARLKDVCSRLLTSDNLLVVYTADAEGYSRPPTELKIFRSVLEQGDGKVYEFELSPDNRDEGFKTASQVNYVVRCGSFAGREAGGRKLEYVGALRVLKVIMNYEYLWINLRVKGGAYGCMSGFSRIGDGCLVSYRDPNLGATSQVYEETPDYLRNFSIDERDMTEYVIDTTSDVDAPLTPSLKGSRNLSAYLPGVTDEMMQKERGQILDVTQEDIRALADIVQAVLDTRVLCVIGNDEQIRVQKGMLGEVKNLYH